MKRIFKNLQKTALIRLFSTKASLALPIGVFLVGLAIFPQPLLAKALSIFTDLFAAEKPAPRILSQVRNSQNMLLLTADVSPDPTFARGGGDIAIVGGNALVAESGPLGTMGNIDDFPLYQRISLYTVRDGDTLAQIAKMYGVSVNTIVWSNNLSGKSIQLGQTLTILPISGIAHTAKKGDTLKSIAKKYKTDAFELALFNDLNEDDMIADGVIITIPEGETVVVPSAAGKIPEKTFKTTVAHDTNGPEFPGYYVRPTSGIKTQGLHGYNGIDIGSPSGTPIYAAAAGDVIISRNSGWNGGYGNYVVISHSNGTQTLYGHMKEVIVAVGDQVYQGQIIGYVGNTGRSTGPHLHFEIRGARNPF